MKFERFAWGVGSLAVTFALGGVWHLIASLELVSKVFLPSPLSAVASLQRGLETGTLLPQVGHTAWRMVVGGLFSALAGVALGAVIGLSDRVRDSLQPLLEAIRPLPASAIIPVAIALMGLDETTVYVVIAFGALWPTLLSTVHGFSSVEPALYEFAQSIRLSRATTILKIALPASLPSILAGVRVSVTIALILSVVAEMLTGQEGVGTWILHAGRAYRSADVFAGVFVLGLLGYLSTQLIDLAERLLLRGRA